MSATHPTARELLQHGVEFVRDACGRIVDVRCPTAETRDEKTARALRNAAAREILRRADLLAPQVFPRRPYPVPRLPGVEPVPARAGKCRTCGEALEAPLCDGGCDLCHAALWRAVRTRTEAARAA